MFCEVSLLNKDKKGYISNSIVKINNVISFNLSSSNLYVFTLYDCFIYDFTLVSYFKCY